MEIVRDVLIKEVDGSKIGDKVFIINYLPKSLLYHKVTKRIIDPNSPDQRMVPEYDVRPNGTKVLTGNKVDELLPGIEMSQTGDGAFCFFTQYNEAQRRLTDIDNYLKATMPVAERLPQREPYALQPGVMTSGTRPLNTLPRVVLPEPVSPPSKDVQEGAPSPVSEPVKERKPRAPMTEQQKEAARERMAKARAAKKGFFSNLLTNKDS